MKIPQPIADSFRHQAEDSEELGSPFTALLCRLLADRLETGSGFGARIATWGGNTTESRLALRAVGGLHALARSGRCPALTAAYPPNAATPDALWAAVEGAVAQEDDFLTARLDGPPQTNEVARSNAILGGCLLIAEATRMPLEINEIGSSAGLNLGFDRYRYDLGAGTWSATDSPVHIRSRWEGDAPALDTPMTVAARAGCDIKPIDPRSPEDRERLLSYVWPDQSERLARTEAALAVAARAEWRVEPADAAEWVEKRFAGAGVAGRTRVLLHTIVWSYLPTATRDRIKAAIETAGAQASADAPVAWLTVEPDGDKWSAAIRLTIWPSGVTRALGRADFHGRWTRWSV
jgi:hypothetical protein